MRGVKLTAISAVLVTMVTLIGCGGGNNKKGSDPTDPVSTLESEIRVTLNGLVTDTDFTLLLTAENGRQFSHSTGTSSAVTSYRSASTSKWVTAAVILSLVEDGVLSLDDHPQNFINTWPTTGNLSEIQLRHLLSFTSGLSEEPLCINGPLQDFADCVDQIATLNAGAPTPGSEFYYSSSHMQVAGLMAVRATGASGWGEIFSNFKSATGLFSTSLYDLPSAQNPRLAGGMHWTATEYLAFLKTLYDETLLSPAMIASMTSDQLQGATIVYTPADAVGEDWHYGFGNWIECHVAVFNCTAPTKNSSPGAYGAYPFIDHQHQYYGILAREGVLGSFAEGYAAFTSVESMLQEWADLNQN